MKFTLNPGTLSYDEIFLLLDESYLIELDIRAIDKIKQSAFTVANVVEENRTVYGINTGFGSLANTKIETHELELLQKSIVLSHAAGTGEFLSDKIVRLILLLKINSLARGYSGVQLKTIEALLSLFNSKVYPCIPCKGSVGASGDLAPLAHLSAVLLGEGNARYEGKIYSAQEALAFARLTPITLGPKEGLALLNGTQVSTAIALKSLFDTQALFYNALIAGALTVDATLGSCVPFDHRIHAVRGHQTQIEVAHQLRKLLENSEINESHKVCSKVQDPYSLRCQPQVMGACLANINFVRDTLIVEANAVSDNPLVFAEQSEILSGGNFHAEPVALAADTLALCIAEIGALSERRTAMLIDDKFSSLPPFLVKNPGVNSGFMIAHVTSTALASENKSLAHPASVDSLPSSANQEDHVSMATYAARRLSTMIENSATIVAIEILAACQGIDFRRPLKSSAVLEKIHTLVRAEVSFYEQDRFFAPDIEKAKMLVVNNLLSSHGLETWNTAKKIDYEAMETAQEKAVLN